MKEILQQTREKRIKDFISSHKFLSNSKYYKTNKVSVAHYESWAAQGKAGGCRICNANHYNYTIHNKRYTTPIGGEHTICRTKGNAWIWQKIGNLCSKCYEEVEKQCSFNFTKY